MVHDEHEYLRQYVDPIIMPMIENLILYQPPDLRQFMLRQLSGEPLGPARYAAKRMSSRTLPLARREKMAQYMTTSVLPVMEYLSTRIMTERPTQVSAFLEELVSSSDFSSAMSGKHHPEELETTPGTERNNQGLGQTSRASQETTTTTTTTLVSETTTMSETTTTTTPIQTEQHSVVLLLGIDNAGKSTFISSLQGEFHKHQFPSVGFTSTSFELGSGHQATFYDLGGGPTIRSVWEEYYADAHGIIYVVDAADASHVAESLEIFRAMTHHDFVRGKPVLVFANKQDCPDALSSVDVAKSFQHPTGAQHTQACTAKVSVSVSDTDMMDERLELGLEWLFDQISRDFDVLGARVTRDCLVKKAQYRDKIDAQKSRVDRWKEERELALMGREDLLAFSPVSAVSTQEVDDDVPKCTQCNAEPATTRCAASKWMPVCDTCFGLIKS